MSSLTGILISNDFLLYDLGGCYEFGIVSKFEIWRDALEYKGFWLSKTKIDYMECKFSITRNKDEEVVNLIV